MHPLEKLLRQRIVIIDGAMGTTIRTYGMKETDIRGARFADSKKDLLNNGDLFSITQPAMIGDIHRRFLEAGADIIETNTFGVTSIALSDFFVEDPREHGGRKDPEFFQKVETTSFSTTSLGKSTRRPRDSAVNGRIALRTRMADSASWQAQSGRLWCRFPIHRMRTTRAFAS